MDEFGKEYVEPLALLIHQARMGQISLEELSSSLATYKSAFRVRIHEQQIEAQENTAAVTTGLTLIEIVGSFFGIRPPGGLGSIWVGRTLTRDAERAKVNRLEKGVILIDKLQFIIRNSPHGSDPFDLLPDLAGELGIKVSQAVLPIHAVKIEPLYYYYSPEGQVTGPYSKEQFSQLCREKIITLETLCAREGDTEWISFADLIVREW